MTAGIQQVAQTAGVSTSTVSRTFTKPELVSEVTRKKVMFAADKLGFRISRSAASLKSGQTMRVAFLTADGVTSWFNSHTFAGLDSVLHPAGYDISVFTMTTTQERKDFFQNLPVLRNVDAVVVNSFDIDPQEVARLDNVHVPIVGINVPSNEGFDATVSIDDCAAMREAVNHLIALGHRNIGFVGETTHSQLKYSADSRLQGFVDECGNHPSIRKTVMLFESGPNCINEAVNAILTAQPAPTAVCFMKDEIAIPALFRLRQYDRQVPQNLSIIGFDDIELARQIGLTTLHQDPYAMGAAAGDKVLFSINEAACTSQNGETAGPPHAHSHAAQGWTTGDKQQARNEQTGTSSQTGTTLSEGSPIERYSVFPVQLMLRETTAPLRA
jgi:LacI family transcriptional regulator, repressor for deo operon, udp, cdd, tsx, nupC, and nupG